MRLVSPCQPSSTTVTSMFRMSPSFKALRGDGPSSPLTQDYHEKLDAPVLHAASKRRQQIRPIAPDFASRAVPKSAKNRLWSRHMNEPSKRLTAAVLVIGDEILSGRTQDVNIATIARFLGSLGIDLCEARCVPDVEDEIVAAVNALRARYTYVFTTGGIGPTHDDITADAIGKAFGRLVEHHPDALAMLAARYAPGEFNERRQRMARVPRGASLIRNSVSVAPGVQIENVFVMAGVRTIMYAVLVDHPPGLSPGVPEKTPRFSLLLPQGRTRAALSQTPRPPPTI